MKNILIAGTSANSKLARFYFEKDMDYIVQAYVVEAAYIKERAFDGLPVFSFEEALEKFPPSSSDMFVAVGYSKMNEVRKKLYFMAKELGYKLPNYISPRASVLTDQITGDNNFILEDNTIQPFVKMGSNNVLWSGNHIGHDGEIGDHNFITSHVVVSGFTKIRNSCFIGVNATIRDDITIEDFTLIAAGAIIMKTTEKYSVHVPARSTQVDKKSTDLVIS